MKEFVYNPSDIDERDLPTIFVFNNGGPSDFLMAIALSEDGNILATHICSHEGFIPYDLGVYEGSREYHREKYREHYWSGYRMRYILIDEINSNELFTSAIAKHNENQLFKMKVNDA